MYESRLNIVSNSGTVYESRLNIVSNSGTVYESRLNIVSNSVAMHESRLNIVSNSGTVQGMHFKLNTLAFIKIQKWLYTTLNPNKQIK